jgi:hypothetical protein
MLEVQAESAGEDRGATFTVRLPLLEMGRPESAGRNNPRIAEPDEVETRILGCLMKMATLLSGESDPGRWNKRDRFPLWL